MLKTAYITELSILILLPLLVIIYCDIEMTFVLPPQISTSTQPLVFMDCPTSLGQSC